MVISLLAFNFCRIFLCRFERLVFGFVEARWFEAYSSIASLKLESKVLVRVSAIDGLKLELT